MQKNFLMAVIILLLIIIFVLFLYIKNQQSIDSFDNLESNLYTYDTCCSQEQIANCIKYGKTGVCNYNNSNNKICECQNSF